MEDLGSVGARCTTLVVVGAVIGVRVKVERVGWGRCDRTSEFLARC